VATHLHQVFPKLGVTTRADWQAVHDLLTKDGYRVAVVQNPILSLEDDTAVTRRVIDELDGPVVLAGHSHGGAVITGAGLHAAWRIKPSWYLVTAEDRMIPPPAQRAMAERTGAAVTEVSGSHSIYLSQPAAVAALINPGCHRHPQVTIRPLAPGPEQVPRSVRNSDFYRTEGPWLDADVLTLMSEKPMFARSSGLARACLRAPMADATARPSPPATHGSPHACGPSRRRAGLPLSARQRWSRITPYFALLSTWPTGKWSWSKR